MKNSEVLIIGGGLAGLTAALDLASRGKQVVVVEKRTYPHHKVCGEYVSNEVRPYLQQLGVNFDNFSAPTIDTLQLSTQKGKSITVDLPLGGFGVSRFTFDNHLFKKAKEKGVKFIFNTVTNVHFFQDSFKVTLASGEVIQCKIVLGAFGKRSNLDKALKRSFLGQRSPWLGIKCHYKHSRYPSNVVGLHNFPGGYGGLSKTEGDTINFCYLVRYSEFKAVGGIDRFNIEKVSQNPILRDFLASAKPEFDTPMSIAQISFERKNPVEDHILMCGDSAGLIHPLCGNGMAMAVHGAKLASEQVNSFLENINLERIVMEKKYKALWESNFKRRLWAGRQLQMLMLHTKWFNIGMHTVANSKSLLQTLIRSTHGTPILS